MSDTVLVECKEGLATVTLNRPGRRNALTAELMTTLATRLRELANERDVRTVVVTGSGELAFSPGADLAPDPDAFPDRGRDETLEEQIDRLRRFQESAWLLHTMPKPTVAAINGMVAGAALSMAAACDFRIASDNAVFSTAFSRTGLAGDFGGSYFLTQLLGTAAARELYLLAERIDAERALRIGLLHRVFPRESFRRESEAFARRLAEGPPLAYRYMKRNLNLALVMHPRDLFDLEAEAMARTARSEDSANARAAFVRKEQPTFEGR